MNYANYCGKLAQILQKFYKQNTNTQKNNIKEKTCDWKKIH